VAAPDPDAPVVAVDVEGDAPVAKPQEDDATVALKAQIDRLNHSEQIVRQQQQAAMLAHAAHEQRQAWLAATPGAKENVSALGAIHHDALDSGLIDLSPGYFTYMERRLAELPRPAAEAVATRLTEEMAGRERAAQPPPTKPTRPIVSAPVSREVPSGSGRRQNSRITLTPQEVEMARISGVSVEEYARQKLRLAQMRASGEYSNEEQGR
jgi:hypothetical protein